MNDLYSMRQGWIYVLTHPLMDGICKIGATRKHPIQRTKELSTSTGVPGPYTLAYYRDFVDCFAAESYLHTRLNSYRVDVSREFFEVTVDEAIKAIRDVGKDVGIDSEGLTGGTEIERQVTIPTPWAELFNSFDPNGPAELTDEEQLQCQQLSETLQQKSRPRRSRSGL